MELRNFGAKVIYPPSLIYPVFHKNIPIVIKNTFNPSAAGTWISVQELSPEGATMVSSINDTCLVTIKGLRMVGVIGINSRIFQCSGAKRHIRVPVSQAASENNISFAVRTPTLSTLTGAQSESAAEFKSGTTERDGSRTQSGHRSHRR